MELTSSDENQVKAGPDPQGEETNSMVLFNGCFTQLCKIPTDMFYYACAALASELSKIWEPVIYWKSDQIMPFWIWAFVREGQSFWL